MDMEDGVEGVAEEFPQAPIGGFRARFEDPGAERPGTVMSNSILRQQSATSRLPGAEHG
jgi:hypothetical protein